MKLLRLITKNFKKLENFEAEFTDGLNVIVGDNAQGKSTLLQAIEAALFGVTVVPGKKENIPTWGQNSFSLELWFEVDGLSYVLTRNKSSAKLVAAGADGEAALLANGNTPVTRYVEDMLGLTAKDFNLFIQSKQGETAGILTFGATALNQKVEEFAGFNLVDEVKSRAQQMAQAEKAAAEATKVNSDELDDAQAAVLAAREKATEAASDLEAANKALEAHTPLTLSKPSVSSEDLRATQRAAQRAEQALREAEADLGHKKQALETARQALAEMPAPVDVEAVKQRAVRTSRVLKETQARLTEVSQQITDHQRAEEAYKEAMGKLEGTEPVEQAALEEAEREHAQLTANLDSLREKLAAAKSKLDGLLQIEKGATCPTCGTTLSEHDPKALAKEIAEQKQEVEDLVRAADLAKTGKDTAANRVAGLVASAAIFKTLQADAEKWKARLADSSAVRDWTEERLQLEQDIGTLQATLAELKVQADAGDEANERRAAAERRVSAAEKAVQVQAVSVEEARSRLIHDAPTDEQIKAVADAEEHYRQVVSEWNLTHQRLESAVREAGLALKHATEAAKAAEQRLGELAKRSEESTQHSVKADQAGRLAKFLAERRHVYLGEVWESVLGVASRQVHVATRGKISRIVNDNGEFGYEEDGVVAPVASASGAQKAFIGSALRIGLARALYGADSLLIFDEPTESMSEHNASGLAASLAGSAKQLLLITHREQDQNLAANIIQVGA